MAVEKKKYIIELPENTHWIQWIMEGTKDHHPYMDYKQVEDLTPYTEPEPHAEVTADAYQRGYEAGLNDAWDVARTLWNMPNRKENIGYTSFNSVITNLTAQEALEEIRAHEQAQKEKEEQITKGDIVRIKSAPEIEILVTYADEEYVSGIALTKVDDSCEIGDQYTDIRICKVEKTGKHYDIAEVLRKMREDTNG